MQGYDNPSILIKSLYPDSFIKKKNRVTGEISPITRNWTDSRFLYVVIMAGLLTCRSSFCRAFPVLSSGILRQKSLLTAPVQRYGFSPYSLFTA